MNLVGKIFVFLIFCMSITFMAFSVVVYSTHTNWRADVLRTDKEVKDSKDLLPLGLKYKLENAEKRTTELLAEIDKKSKEIAAIKAANVQALSKLETEKAVLLAQQQEALKANSDLQANLSVALNKVQTEQAKFNSLEERNLLLKKEIQLARQKIDEEFQQVVVLQEERNQSGNDLQRIEIRNKELVEEVRKWAVLTHSITGDNTITADTPLDYKKAPPIDGLVTGVRVNGPDTYAQLSIGSDVGVRIGHSLEVYRGGQYVGRLTVIRTTPDGSVGKMDAGQKAEVLRGDKVESRRSLQLTSG